MLIPIMDVHYVQKVMFSVVSTECHGSGGSNLPVLAEVHIQFGGFFCVVSCGQWHWERFLCKCFGFLCHCPTTNGP
jgi:hypothetical protein